MANEERQYFVLCQDNCRFEGMTKEQIIAAIAEATGETPTHIDDAFITKIKELNKNSALKWWVGTEAEYNALSSHASDVLYIIKDKSETDVFESQIIELEERKHLTNRLGEIVSFGTGHIDTCWYDIKEFSDGSVEAVMNKEFTLSISEAETKVIPFDLPTDYNNLKIESISINQIDNLDQVIYNVMHGDTNIAMKFWLYDAEDTIIDEAFYVHVKLVGSVGDN